jgi:hypothetical protein
MKEKADTGTVRTDEECDGLLGEDVAARVELLGVVDPCDPVQVDVTIVGLVMLRERAHHLGQHVEPVHTHPRPKSPSL